MFHARILRIHFDGSTSSIVGDFESQNNALERARNDIEIHNHDGIVATLVLTSDPIAHYEAVEAGRWSSGVVRYRAEKAVGFKEVG